MLVRIRFFHLHGVNIGSLLQLCMSFWTVMELGFIMQETRFLAYGRMMDYAMDCLGFGFGLVILDNVIL